MHQPTRPIAPPPPWPPSEQDRRIQSRQSTYDPSDVPAYYPAASSTSRPPPFLHHNSEGTNHYNHDATTYPSSSSNPPSSWRPPRASASTSDLPSGDVVGRRLSRTGGSLNSTSSQYAYQNRQPGASNREEYGYGDFPSARSPPPPPPPHRPSSGGRTPPRPNDEDRELEEAMRASRLEAELAMAEQESSRAEEDRLLKSALAASSYSAEQDLLRAERLAAEKRAELDAIQKAITQSQIQADKGKQRETDEEREEREAIEYATALSISEMNARKSSRAFRGETSAQMFARLSRPSIQVDPDDADMSPTPSPATNPTTPSPLVLQPRATSSDNSTRPTQGSSSSVVSETAPPAYEYPKVVDNPRAIVLGPGRPLPRPHGPPGNQPPKAAVAPRRSASSASSSSSPLQPQTSPHSRHASFSRVTTSSSQSNRPSDPSSYYSASVAAATAPTRRPNIFADWSSPHSTPHTDDTPLPEMNPFDDSHAVIGPPKASFEDLKIQPRSTSLTSSSSTSLPSQGVLEPDAPSQFRPRLSTAGSSASLPTLPSASSSLALPAPSPSTALAGRRASPLFGGLVDFSTANAVADEEVTKGVTFGFVPPGSQGRERQPLQHDGAFPDVAQLSRVGSLEGGSLEFETFAVEARGWQPLLSYLMWHGNSHMEAAPSDLRSEKIGDGLCCAVVLDFFRAGADRQPRVRCRMSLLPPRHQYDPFAGNDPVIFDAEYPNITIRFPSPPLLPLKLSTLATTLSTAHTLSRRHRTDARTASISPDMRTIRDLAQAIDLFKTLNGEVVVDDAEEVQIAEDNWLSGMKLRLKRKKKGPGIVKGGADGTGGGRPLEGNMVLPEAALLVTPFRLDDV